MNWKCNTWGKTRSGRKTVLTEINSRDYFSCLQSGAVDARLLRDVYVCQLPEHDPGEVAECVV